MDARNSEPRTPVVETTAGQLRGTSAGGIAAFKGIP
jgi:carboxylesterase type B